jgi:hypothetical protein
MMDKDLKEIVLKSGMHMMKRNMCATDTGIRALPVPLCLSCLILM